MDLFCGAGGFSEGFRQAGFEILAGVDNWVRALQTFKLNHPSSQPIYADVRSWKSGGLQTDIVIGGPPCPEFSYAKREKDPERGMELVYAFFVVVDTLKPKYWCIENVPGAIPYIKPLVMSHGGRIYLLDAADYGVPQNRRRMFGMNFQRPTPTHAENPSDTLDGRLSKWLSVKDTLMGEGKASHNHRLVSDADLDRFNRHRAKIGLKAAPDSIDEPSRSILASEGRNTEKGMIIEEVVSSPSNTIDVDGYLRTGRRRRVDGKAVLTSIYERRIRKLSTRECARLQSFPDSFRFVGCQSDKYTLIGNTVPPLLARAIAEGMPN